MARKKRRSGSNFQAKIFKWLRMGMLAAPAAAILVQTDKTGEAKIEEIVEAYSGYNIPHRKMNWGSLLRGWGPFIGTVLATYGIPKIASIIRRL